MPAMKFYMTPGSCTTGIHILLEEIDIPFEAYILNLPAGDQYKPDYLAVNPKSSIPTLVRNDGAALTEFQAIAWWLARSYPKAKLLPDNLEGEVKALELMDYVVGTLHMQGFARIFATYNFTAGGADEERVRAQGKQIVEKGFIVINTQLPDKGYALGEFSIADAALFYVEFWAAKLNMSMPPNCRAHYQLMLERPVVQRVLREEGYR
ncbi:glutathione S-transferase domain-containing protein [Methyloglobulus morosus KoM1]|uniref:Glutathione S-transferase domain-containing protein n=1 Tax=Methyloglobulus morosus KoM1 TaxID=1116472 RepID=V5BK70_9GAMM|nr:glutathione S-transferase N-terminal domain-containing protein [Methyloglobulus morosus]ESS73715.1 glutathione S-transferase domain-containing protein [Methyloglobulus morosus KoM1]